MAYYKVLDYLQEEQGPIYDQYHQAGTPAPLSGVYRCNICWKSTAAIRNHPLPSVEPGHEHDLPMPWMLVCRSDLAGG